MTDKQRKFCVEYVRCRNASKAALEAGFSKSYAKARAHELLRIPEIEAEVEKLEGEYYRQTFKELALKGLHAIGEIIESNQNPTARLRASELALRQAGFIDPAKVDQDLAIIVKLPEDLKNGRRS